MRIKIIGWDHVKGDKSNKTGKPYDFYNVFTLLRIGSPDSKGFAGTSITVEPHEFESVRHLPVPLDCDVIETEVLAYGKSQKRLTDFTPISV